MRWVFPGAVSVFDQLNRFLFVHILLLYDDAILHQLKLIFHVLGNDFHCLTKNPNLIKERSILKSCLAEIDSLSNSASYFTNKRINI